MASSESGDWVTRAVAAIQAHPATVGELRRQVVGVAEGEMGPPGEPGRITERRLTNEEWLARFERILRQLLCWFVVVLWGGACATAPSDPMAGQVYALTQIEGQPLPHGQTVAAHLFVLTDSTVAFQEQRGSPAFSALLRSDGIAVIDPEYITIRWVGLSFTDLPPVLALRRTGGGVLLLNQPPFRWRFERVP